LFVVCRTPHCTSGSARPLGNGDQVCFGALPFLLPGPLVFSLPVPYLVCSGLSPIVDPFEVRIFPLPTPVLFALLTALTR
jgi:hypothetical protein